ncbi:MAG: type II toxin-antitoxin system PemK/MazF family toxin [Candidatus Korobacteraceae bacterium]
MDVVKGGIYLYEPPKSSTSEQAAILTQSGSEQAGLRPFIIVSRDEVNSGKPTAVGVPLTSRVHKANSYRIFLPAAELIADEGCTAFVDSVAMCDHIRVLNLELIRKKIGRLSDTAVAGVATGLIFVFDIR